MGFFFASRSEIIEVLIQNTFLLMRREMFLVRHKGVIEYRHTHIQQGNILSPVLLMAAWKEETPLTNHLLDSYNRNSTLSLTLLSNPLAIL